MTRDDALTLATRGFRIVPAHSIMEGRCSCGKAHCDTPGKHPRLTGWQAKGTCDLDTIGAWWDRWPDANIAILCGAGLAVLDVDEKGWEALEAFEREHGKLPDTARVLSGSGKGAHLYFATAGNVVSHDRAPGLEVRAAERVVIAPPSMHGSGRRYEWAEGEPPHLGDLAQLPAALTVKPSTPGSSKRRPEPGEKIAAGGRHAAMLSVAGAMRRVGAGESEIAAALDALNRERCDPPKPEAVVQALAADVADRYEPNGASRGDPEPDDLRARLTAALKLNAAAVRVVGAEVHGRGLSAIASIALSNRRTIEVDRFQHLTQPQALSALVIEATGQPVSFDARQCRTIAAMVVQLAERGEQVDANDLARDWGEAFLRAVDVIDVVLSEQRERWAAFSRIADRDPIALANASRTGIARCCEVLRDADGSRYVHCPWFHAHVRRDNTPIAPAELVNRMSRVGWTRRNRRGAIKATRPSSKESLILPFYVVPPGWEDR